MNYGLEVPFDHIRKDEVVYIVDFSIEHDDMRKLLASQPCSPDIYLGHGIIDVGKSIDELCASN